MLPRLPLARRPHAPSAPPSSAPRIGPSRAAGERLEPRVLFSAVRQLPEFLAHSLGPADDKSLFVPLGFAAPVDAFGGSYDGVFVNNNGNVTFGGSFSSFRPGPLANLTRPMLAPFFADVDTLFGGSPVTYGTATIDGRAAFGVDWLNVDYFLSDASHANHNSFQLVLIDRSDVAPGDFDVEFNYDSVLWEAGVLSGGDADGLGGQAARAGFTSGTGPARPSNCPAPERPAACSTPTRTASPTTRSTATSLAATSSPSAAACSSTPRTTPRRPWSSRPT